VRGAWVKPSKRGCELKVQERERDLLVSDRLRTAPSQTRPRHKLDWTWIKPYPNLHTHGSNLWLLCQTILDLTVDLDLDLDTCLGI